MEEEAKALEEGSLEVTQKSLNPSKLHHGCTSKAPEFEAKVTNHDHDFGSVDDEALNLAASTGGEQLCRATESADIQIFLLSFIPLMSRRAH